MPVDLSDREDDFANAEEEKAKNLIQSPTENTPSR